MTRDARSSRGEYSEQVARTSSHVFGFGSEAVGSGSRWTVHLCFELCQLIKAPL
jgi:hypothetical protein